MKNYQTVQGDTWDGISFKLFGDTVHMTFLLNANPEQARTVIFGGGVQLQVPDKPTETSSDLPPWRKEEE